MLLSTGHVEEAEDRIEGGEVHFDTIRPGDLHVYSRARNEQHHRFRWHSPLSFANVMLPPSVVADACRDAGLDYENTTFVDAFFADDLLLTQMVRQLGRKVQQKPAPASLYGAQLLQTIAAHLVRHYTTASRCSRPSSESLPVAPALQVAPRRGIELKGRPHKRVAPGRNRGRRRQPQRRPQVLHP